MSNSSINIQTTDFKGNSLGTGTTIYDSVNPFNTLNFKSISSANAGITINSTGDTIILSANTALSGEANTASNIGVGFGLYSTKVGDDLRFKSLIGVGQVSISNVGSEIQISGTSVALAAGDITQVQFNETKIIASGTGFTTIINQLGASSGFTFSASTQSLTVGTRGTGAEGCGSFSHGYTNLASGCYSFAGGRSVQALGDCSFSQGQNNIAQATGSAILGGNNNNIAIGNTNAAIIGGNNIDLTGTSYIDTTAVGSLAILTSPTNNTSSDEILVRNTSTGIVDYISKASIGATDIYVSGGTLDGSAILALARSEGQADVNIDLSALSGGSGGLSTTANGISDNGTTITLGGLLTGNTIIDTNGYSVGFGASTTIIGNNSFAHGNSTATGGTSFAIGNSIAGGLLSFAQGNASKAMGNCSNATGENTRACADASHAEGRLTRAYADNSHAEGNFSRTCASATNSHAEGYYSKTVGIASHAEGAYTFACGTGSHSGGYGCIGGGRFLIAQGYSSFNHSLNSLSQIGGHGALADNSAILGGIDHNIEVGNTGATIIGGNAIKLTGTSYIDTTAVDNLAIMSIPTSGNSTQILARNTSTGVIEYTTVSGGGGGSPAGTNKSIQFNNSGSFGADSSFCFSYSQNGLTLGTRLAGIEGSNSFGIGNTNLVSGIGSFAIGACNCVTGQFSSAKGLCTCATGQESFAEGVRTKATGTQAAHAEGIGSKAYGNWSHAEGSYTKAYGNGSHAEGRFSAACGTHSHAEGQYGHACGAFSHVEGQFNHAVNAGAHAEGQFTCAVGSSSHTGGKGNTLPKSIFACGYSSFNHSFNTISQTAGHGANADYSTVLGGIDHDIASLNVRAAIIGGNGIKLTSNTYIDHTVVDKFAIWTPPNVTTDANLLTWNSTTRKVGYIAKTDGSITSDKRLKTCIEPILNVDLSEICGVSFEFNELTPQAGSCAYGVIAQDVEKVFPLVVKDKGVEHNGEFYKTVDYTQLTPILLNKIKELEERIIELEK